jgi:hypothetical protein
MWLLTAAVVLFGAVTTLNLILTLGVIKRLREQADQLASGGGGAQELTPLLNAGELPAEFTTTSVDGDVVSRDGPAGLRLLAFVSPLCDMCAAQIPDLLDRAAHMPGGRDNVIVVTVGKGAEVAEYGEQFRPVAQVVHETGTGAITRAYKLGGLPAFGLIDHDGRVLTSTVAIDRLDVPVAS